MAENLTPTGRTLDSEGYIQTEPYTVDSEAGMLGVVDIMNSSHQTIVTIIDQQLAQ